LPAAPPAEPPQIASSHWRLKGSLTPFLLLSQLPSAIRSSGTDLLPAFDSQTATRLTIVLVCWSPMLATLTPLSSPLMVLILTFSHFLSHSAHYIAKLVTTGSFSALALFIPYARFSLPQNPAARPELPIKDQLHRYRKTFKDYSRSSPSVLPPLHYPLIVKSNDSIDDLLHTGPSIFGYVTSSLSTVFPPQVARAFPRPALVSMTFYWSLDHGMRQHATHFLSFSPAAPTEQCQREEDP